MNGLLIFDGSDKLAMKIGEIYGFYENKKLKSISSSGMMFIEFKKQTRTGFLFEFVAFIKYNKINPDCQSWLNNNILMTPKNPNINCSWIITRKFGSYITLDFSFIEVNPMNIYCSKNTLI